MKDASGRPDQTAIPVRILGRLLAVAGLALGLGVGVAGPLPAREDIRVGGTGSAMGTMRLLAQAYAKKHPATRVEVLPSLGSTGGIKAVLAGKIELAASARPLKNTETLQGASQFEIGCTPMVLATYAGNPVSNLSLAQLIDIYSGKTHSWPDGETIRLVLRPADEIDTETLRSLSPEMRKAVELASTRKGLPFAVTDQETADTIEKIPGALGTSTLAQILTEQRPLKILRLNGIEPNARTIQDGSYPMCRRLFLVASPLTSVAARQFLAFVQSAEGRAILRRSGYTQQY